jgi:hypothetical protein
MDKVLRFSWPPPPPKPARGLFDLANLNEDPLHKALGLASLTPPYPPKR